MFKSRLIEDYRYYHFRSFRVFAFILTFISLLIYVLGRILDLASPLTLLSIFVTFQVVTLLITWLGNTKMKQYISNKYLEIDQEKVKIFNESGSILKEMKFNDFDEVKVSDKFSIGIYHYKDVLYEMFYGPKINFISLKKEGISTRLEFDIENHYSLSQINKIVKGIKVRADELEAIQAA